MREPSAATPDNPEAFGCMEVWGGPGLADRYISRPGLDIWTANRVAETQSAGLQFVTSCASGRITRMMLADMVSNEGMFERSAAAMRDALKRNINRINQARCEKEVSSLLVNCAAEGGFGSTLLATYFSPTSRLTVCNAGNPPPLIYKAADDSWSVLKGEVKTNAAAQDEALLSQGEYSHASVELGCSDMALFYSESLFECRTAENMPTGVCYLLEKARSLWNGEASTFASDLLRSIERECDGNLAGLDAKVLLCRKSDRGTGWSNNLLAPFRLLGPITDRTGL